MTKPINILFVSIVLCLSLSLPCFASSDNMSVPPSVTADVVSTSDFTASNHSPPSGLPGGGEDLTVFRLQRVHEAFGYIYDSIGSIFTVAVWLFLSVLGVYLVLDIASDIGR